MNLLSHPPRSPFDHLAGVAWLPRLIDKAKARMAEQQGPYMYNSPLDRDFFAFFGLGYDTFYVSVRRLGADEAIETWFNAHVSAVGADKDAWNAQILAAKPDTPEAQAYFDAMLAAAAPGRTDITTWCALLVEDDARPFRKSMMARLFPAV